MTAEAGIRRVSWFVVMFSPLFIPRGKEGGGRGGGGAGGRKIKAPSPSPGLGLGCVDTDTSKNTEATLKSCYVLHTYVGDCLQP